MPPYLPPPSPYAGYAWLDDGPPPPDQGVRTHDGLYARLALGLGWMSGSQDGPRVHDDIGYGGRGFSFELAIGGTPAPGLVVGSALAAARYGDLHRDDDGVSSRSAFSFYQLKSFADWYFDPHAGLHAQVGLGIGVMEGGVREPATDAPGAVASLGLGYEWWIGEQWSAGVLAKVDGYALSRKQMPERVLAPGILGTLTWH